MERAEIEKRDSREVARLLSAGADPNTRDKDGWPAPLLETMRFKGGRKVELDAPATRILADSMTRFLTENPERLDEVLSVLERLERRFAGSLEKHAEDPQTAPSISALVSLVAALSGRENECECEVAL